MTNPFLPLDVYIPDGEPHVFGGRVYLFGSHDDQNGDTYCPLDYEFYSAPVDDLGNWTSRGINYRAQQDPLYATGRTYLYAPDVVQGNDGNYYLYYCMAGEGGRQGYWGPLSVAVATEAGGTYEYLGVVRNGDGSTFDEHVLFDPAVINDDGQIRLYYGMCYPFSDRPLSSVARPITQRVQASMFNKSLAEVKKYDDIQGAITVELADDMMTVTSVPRRIVPTSTKGTTFEGHAFWEGSSIRKIGGTYYFIYSSFLSHELCYATSTQPDRDFVFRGTIVSNGDIGFEGRVARDRTNFTATNHGSIENINGDWYVFYHRNTHGTIYQRQACAERITIDDRGLIAQVPVSTSGFTPPVSTVGVIAAATCSTLTNGRMPHVKVRRPIPMVTHDSADTYIAGIKAGVEISWRGLVIESAIRLTVRTRGSGTGAFVVDGEPQKTTVAVAASPSWKMTQAVLRPTGTAPFTLRYEGEGTVELLDLEFEPLADL